MDNHLYIYVPFKSNESRQYAQVLLRGFIWHALETFSMFSMLHGKKYSACMMNHRQPTVLSYVFQSWCATRRRGGGDERSDGEHFRGDLPGRPQQRQNHHGGAERAQAASPANDSRVHRVTHRPSHMSSSRT